MGRAILFAVALFAACSSTDTTPPVDAAQPGDAAQVQTVDAATGSKAAFGAQCTTVTDTSTECASGVCTNTFNMFPTPVCSQKCTVQGGTDPTCPVGSMGQKCNQQFYCRP
jgi:hypothetical protein